MNLPLLQNIVIILSFSILVVFILRRFDLPSILGFIITGAIIGPYGLGFIGTGHEVDIISEIGVILLLFVIGMELSIKQLAAIKRTIFIGGVIQVGVSVLLATLLAKLTGLKWNEAVFTGFLVSLSSTAIVLKILQDRNEISAPHGRNALGMLIFQDIIVIPMILVTPVLSGESANIGVELLELFIKSGLIIVFTLISARYIVPHLMHLIARAKSKELFLITTLTLCFAVAWLTSEAGLSLALGAFLAGLIISESEYSNQATSLILPFKELFTSFFFISIGMLLDLSFFIENGGYVLLVVLVVFILKASVAAFAAALLRYPPRIAILTGFALFQIGEFSFILSKVGVEHGILSEGINQYFLSVSIVTMFLTPFVFMFSENLSAIIVPAGIQKRWGLFVSRRSQKSKTEHIVLENHLIIVGYGVNGRNVARAAKHIKIPYVILELNPETVRNEKSKGENILFGDASHQHILETVKLNKARAIVVAISDPIATKYIISNIRSICKSVYVIVRSRYVEEIDELISLGADEVIPEEFETSVAIFSRVLQNFLVPVDEIDHLVKAIRADNYKLFQQQGKMPRTIKPVDIPDFKVTCVKVEADSGGIVNHTLAQADIRKRFGVLVIAIYRREKMIYPVQPGHKLMQNDLVYISGEPESIDKFYKAVRVR